MGLDTYASNTPGEIQLTSEQARAFEEADIHLGGGILSGGSGSFRGKVYVEVVMDVTGEHLYQDWIPPETVRKMYRALAACDPEKVAEETEIWQVSATEIVELTRFFKVCVEHDLGLVGWW
jgi:hypothetical protein